MVDEHKPLKVIKQPEDLEATALKRYQAWLERSRKKQAETLFSVPYQNLIARLNRNKPNPDGMQSFLTPQSAEDYLSFRDSSVDYFPYEDERTKKMYQAMFGETKEYSREQQQEDLNMVLAKYSDLIEKLNFSFLPPDNLQDSRIFSEAFIRLHCASDLTADSQPANETYDDEGQKALEQMAHDAQEKGLMLLAKESLSSLRLTMINLANVVGRKQALAYFQHSFVYILQDYLANFGLKAPANLVLKVHPTVRKNYEDHKKWVDALPENTNKEEGREFFQRYLDNLVEQAGPLFNNLSQEKQEAIKTEGLIKIGEKIAALGQSLNFGTEREISAAKDFLKDFPDLFDFVRLILNTNNPIWQQQAKKKE